MRRSIICFNVSRAIAAGLESVAMVVCELRDVKLGTALCLQQEFVCLDAEARRFSYNSRLECQVCPRSMKVVQLICNHQVVVRFRAGAPIDSGHVASSLFPSLAG